MRQPGVLSLPEGADALAAWTAEAATTLRDEVCFMVKATDKGVIHAELERLPEHLVGEILGGTLVASPRPGPRHALALWRMGTRLGDSFDSEGKGGWWILAEPELHLGPDVVVPDLAGWRRERMPALPKEAFFSLPPDWVCEILSSSTAATDRTRKMPIYAREGVPFLWLVDPTCRTLEAYLLCDRGWLLQGAHQGDATVRVPPFEEVGLSLAPWWLPEED